MSEVKYPKKSEEVCARCKYGFYNCCHDSSCQRCPMYRFSGSIEPEVCKCNALNMGEECTMFEEFKGASDE